MRIPIVSRERFEDLKVEKLQLYERLTTAEKHRDALLEMVAQLAKALESPQTVTQEAEGPQAYRAKIRDVVALATKNARDRYELNKKAV